MRTNCTRCGGTGRIDMYSHVAYGICFACGGNPNVPAPAPEPRMSYAECYARYGALIDELVALVKIETWARRQRRTLCEIAASTLDNVRRGVTTDPANIRREITRCRRELRVEAMPLPRLIDLAKRLDKAA